MLTDRGRGTFAASAQQPSRTFRYCRD